MDRITRATLIMELLYVKSVILFVDPFIHCKGTATFWDRQIIIAV